MMDAFGWRSLLHFAVVVVIACLLQSAVFGNTYVNFLSFTYGLRYGVLLNNTEPASIFFD